MMWISNAGIIHTCVVLFGTGAWVAVNGVYVELPVIVPFLPEGWALPSYMTLIVQIANIAPLTVVIFQTCCAKLYHMKACINTIIWLGVTACFLLAMFWDYTIYINGAYHSVPFLTLFGVLSVVDTTSSVTFLPYMTLFQPIFITSYYIGEGLSGFIPSLLALAQGASESYCVNTTITNSTTNTSSVISVSQYSDPRYSASVFFGLLSVMMVICGVSFIFLNKSKMAKRFWQFQPCETYKDAVVLQNQNFDDKEINKKEDGQLDMQTENQSNKLSRNEYIFLFITVGWVNSLTNGVLPSISSYTSLPYGSNAYHLSATFSAMANPTACFIAIFVATKSKWIILLLTLLGTGCAAYLIMLAAQSPCPILVNSTGGAAIMIIMWVLFIGILSYIKVTTGQIFRDRGHKSSLLWYGAVVQLGSLIGALIIFPLVNRYHLFQSGDSCSLVCT